MAPVTFCEVALRDVRRNQLQMRLLMAASAEDFHAVIPAAAKQGK